MAGIQFESGIREYPLRLYEGQDPVVVRFNPTNMIFVERVLNAFDRMDEIQEDYRKRIDAVDPERDYKAVFELTHGMEDALRETLNDTFNMDICTPLFGAYESVYAAGEGFPIWANILLAVVDEFDESFVKEREKTNPRLKKYTDKYRKRSK